MAKEHSIKDYEKALNETLQRYGMDKINHGLDFTKRQWKNEHFESIMIVNRMTATKILFDHQMKLLITKEIFVGEAKMITEMLEEVNNG